MEGRPPGGLFLFAVTVPSPSPDFLRRGTPAYRRANLGLFCSALATFALLYSPQPILPLLAAEFGVSAATSALSLSLSTGALAACLLVAGAVSESRGRKPVMVAALTVAGVLGLASACATDWTLLLAARLLLGMALAGLPALAMAWLGEEVEPRSLPSAMGLLVAGNALGGFLGRLLSGVLAEIGGWRLALGGIGLLALAAAACFALLLPPSRHFRPQPLRLAALAGNYAAHLRQPGLRRLFAQSFMLMGGFVALFNYLPFRLQQPPFGLSAAAVGLLSVVYLLGMGSAGLAGRLVGRWGPGRVQRAGIACMVAGTAACAAPWLPAVMAGLGVIAVGFFCAHAVGSAEVGRQALAARAQASSLYLGCYYLGSSVVGWAAGYLWGRAGWLAVLAAVAALFTLACLRVGVIKTTHAG